MQLVALGLVDRTDIPPVALFRLQDRNLASRLVSQLAQLREDFFEQVTRSARSIEPAPINVTVVGSMARGQAGAESDIDLLVVRASDTEADDDLWVKSLGMFEEELEALAGNPPNLIEVAEGEMPELLGGKEGLWKQFEEEGLVLLGVPLAKFQNGNG